MKLILAMIPPEDKEAVCAALETTEATLIYTADVLDLRDKVRETFRGIRYQVPSIKTKVEILVLNDMLVEEIVAAIAGTDDTQRAGKSQIVVMTVDEWIPVRGREPRLTPAIAA